MKKLILSLVLALVLVLLSSSPALAIGSPDSISLTIPIQVYHSLLEANDTLFIAKYYLPYTELPDENITEAYLGRLLDSEGGPVGAARLYAYHDKGYGYGIFSLYFGVGEVTWGGTYSIQLIGNPGLSWEGSIPSAETTSLNWNDSSSGLSVYTLTLANDLEGAWNMDLYSETAQKLTSTYGEAYFTSAIPYLRLFTPDIFAVERRAPQVVPEEHPRTYLQELLDRWVGTDYDEAFDSLSEYVGLPRTFLTGGLWLLLMMVGSYFIVRSAHSARPLPLFLFLLLILGTLSGFVSALIPILIAAAFAIFIGFILFYRTGT